MTNTNRRLSSWLVAFATLAGAQISYGAFDLNTVISGAAPVSSGDPWVRATVTDAGANQVDLKLEALNLTDKENVQFWAFNIDPKITQEELDTLSIKTVVLNQGAIDTTKVSLKKTTVDGVTIASFTFDFEFGLPPGGSDLNKQFTQGDKVTLTLAMTPDSPNAFTAASFNYLDTTGTYFSAAHVQNIEGAVTSGWIGATPVPEPTTFIAGALLLLPFGVSALRVVRKNRKA